ncbi:M15 family metallopeptidase [Heyndrickxia vini]|uniref:M15 family metallopeptidase n=1 Tax=Heyndrickxia vini TaxID=1476025 RepID=A0ABX7E2N8_9BACI|nr:M15 family metallopeptidase [Heyndrickxia vini]QQZ09767.1 M15 family metallopeptidase [Heyndrickxia vini]
MKKVALTSLIVTLLLAGCSEMGKSPDNIKKRDDEVSKNKNTLVDDRSEQGEQDKNNQLNNNDTAKKNDKTDNQTKNSEGVPVVANPTAIAVMVNKSNALPDGYRPNDLVRPKVKFVFGDQKLDKALMRAEAAASLEKMFNQASSQGIQLYAASGFRSYETQDYLFKQEIKNVGREKAELAVAKPGTSEHQTGLTMDISAPSVNYTLTQNFESKNEGKWLAEHAHEFGFILRYPKGKEDITKYQFEPWHFRYVGKEIATEIYKKGITLEEYFDGKQGI